MSIKINLFFWQNCISPHQIGYIKELHNDPRINKVYLIVPLSTLEEREKMGWKQEIPNFQETTIIISPTIQHVSELMANNIENTIHLFSGIRGDKNVFQYFKDSLKFPLTRGIITEPPFDYITPLFLHKIRFFLFDFKYTSRINFVFGMGDRAVEYYKFWSKKWKVMLFGYCVDISCSSTFSSNMKNESNLRFVYVGSLIKLKNVVLLLSALKKLPNKSNFSLVIIGDGPEKAHLQNYVQMNGLTDNVSFWGRLPISQVHQKLSDFDVLIMPSIRDGWGAVINEGLHNGLFIVSSDNCGAKTLIENSNRGKIFKNKNLQSLIDELNYCIQNKFTIKSSKQERIEWSKNISGSIMAKYMVDCLTQKEFVSPPWKKE